MDGKFTTISDKIQGSEKDLMHDCKKRVWG